MVTSLSELLLTFLGLGIIVQSIHIIYNYRNTIAAMRIIEKVVSSGADDAGSIAIIPCRVAASSLDEVLYTIGSLKRSLDLGYLSRGIIIVERGEEESLKSVGVDGKGITILVSRADECTTCSGKNRALIAGLRSFDREAGGYETIVMLDCDAYHHPRSIHYVSRASSVFGGIVTGYRWYLLRDIYSVLYNVVSSIAFEYMGIDRIRIVWGGLAAMPLSVARDLGLEEKFREELSDDAVINREARRNGYRIIFCSKCISLTPAQRGFKNFYSWAVRQMIVLRLYSPLGFKILMSIYAMNTLVMFLPAILVMVGAPGWALSALALAVSGYVLIGALRAYIALRSYSPGSLYQDLDLEGDKGFWGYIYVLISSLRAPLILSILITARISRRFVWRGVEYCIVDRGRRAVPCNTRHR